MARLTRYGHFNVRSAPEQITPDIVARLLAIIPAPAAPPAPVAPLKIRYPKATTALLPPSEEQPLAGAVVIYPAEAPALYSPEAPEDDGIAPRSEPEELRDEPAADALPPASAAGKNPARIPIGRVDAVQPKPTIRKPWFELQKEQLEEAIRFLKSRAILVDIIDRTAPVARYHVTGGGNWNYAQDVIDLAARIKRREAKING